MKTLILIESLILLYIYIVSMMSLYFVREHILLCLLSLEFIILSLLIMLSLYFLMFSFSLYFLIFLMIFFVMEGVLGLSVMVFLIRNYGNDYLNSFSLW